MPTQLPLEILKEALLLERRGNAFYNKVAGQAQSETVRSFFKTMADEELRHMAILEEQFKAYSEKQQFADVDVLLLGETAMADAVLTDDLKAEIAAAGFEAAAISAAMLMEEQAISLYADRARGASDPNEKALYRWLAEWEHGHLNFLARMDREIKAEIWEDNHFWPM
jgi:rubrerythrin